MFRKLRKNVSARKVNSPRTKLCSSTLLARGNIFRVLIPVFQDSSKATPTAWHRVATPTHSEDVNELDRDTRQETNQRSHSHHTAAHGHGYWSIVLAEPCKWSIQAYVSFANTDLELAKSAAHSTNFLVGQQHQQRQRAGQRCTRTCSHQCARCIRRCGGLHAASSWLLAVGNATDGTHCQGSDTQDILQLGQGRAHTSSLALEEYVKDWIFVACD